MWTTQAPNPEKCPTKAECTSTSQKFEQTKKKKQTKELLTDTWTEECHSNRSTVDVSQEIIFDFKNEFKCTAFCCKKDQSGQSGNGTHLFSYKKNY